MHQFKASFWDRKILSWEKSRYGFLPAASGNSSFFSPKNSVHARMVFAKGLLKANTPGARILELGCGSGRFLRSLYELGPKKLIGIDFSSAAISAAKELNREELFDFRVGDVVEMPFPDSDIVVGLGLLDWLSLGEIGALFRKIQGRRFLFSFSEKRPSLKRYLHAAYVRIHYGWKSKGYLPRYYDVGDLQNTFAQSERTPLFYFRRPNLSFGTFVSNFPLSLGEET